MNEGDVLETTFSLIIAYQVQTSRIQAKPMFKFCVPFLYAVWHGLCYLLWDSRVCKPVKESGTSPRPSWANGYSKATWCRRKRKLLQVLRKSYDTLFFQWHAKQLCQDSVQRLPSVLCNSACVTDVHVATSPCSNMLGFCLIRCPGEWSIFKAPDASDLRKVVEEDSK